MESKRFNPQRLDIARKLRQMTKRELSAVVGVTAHSLTSAYMDAHEPKEATVERFSEVLNFPIQFFYEGDVDEPSQDGVSFRALSTLTARLRDQALSLGALGIKFSDYVESRFNLPDPNIPSYGDISVPTDLVGAVAMDVRNEWGLGQLSIGNMVHLLESKGVRVLALNQSTEKADAFSFWRNERPFVMLNTRKSAERSRMDAAHELGHLVLHTRGKVNGSRQTEKEANLFASCFLMPEGDILASNPGRWASLSDIVRGKKRWRVSAAALVYRMQDLGLLTEHRYKDLFIQMSQLGWRSNEPEPCPRERSQVLDKVFALLRDRGVTFGDVAEALSVYPEDLWGLLSGLVSFTAPLRRNDVEVAPVSRGDKAHLRVIPGGMDSSMHD